MKPLTIFGLFAVAAMLVCYALERRNRWFTHWGSPEHVCSARSTGFFRELGHSASWRASGPSSLSAAGGWRKTQF